MEIQIIIFPLVALVIGAIGGYFWYRNQQKGTLEVWNERQNQWRESQHSLESKVNELSTFVDGLRDEKQHLTLELTRTESNMAALKELQISQQEESQKLQEKMQKDFEILANKILEDKSRKFTEKNEASLKGILNPLQTKITEFQSKVEESQHKNIGIHAALKQQLEQLQNQNLKIGQEAQNLAKALKGDKKAQGSWGELVLERVLEKSGLEKDREYSVQKSFRKEDGSRSMPDVIIHLPDGKKMIVDSKVSLVDYERYINAEELEAPKWLKAHIDSLKRHVAQLSAKKYEDLYAMESPDFVLMFIPVEPAFAVAINQEAQLYSTAFEQNIVIVTPTTLLATLRTIDTMWNNDKQRRNAIEIARQAGGLYDKFVGLIDDLNHIGNNLQRTQNVYVGAMKKLSEGDGNLIRRVERLKKMGAKAKKEIPANYIERAMESETQNEDQPKLDLR